MFIGEAPGAQENKRGTVFIGKTGDEVNRHYLPLAGLSRSGVRFTNAIRCLPPSAGGKLDPKKVGDVALLHSCAAAFLYPSIEENPPRVIVAMGSFACRSVLGDSFDLEMEHGIPQDTKWGWVFPMYHPALGIYEPKKMLLLRNDWIRLKRYLKGKLVLPEDLYPTPDYREVTDADEVAQLDPTSPLAGDTESRRDGKPFCLTYSQSPGQGRLIRADNLPVLQAFARRVKDWQAPILFHFWFHDWPVAAEMGVQFPYRHIVDTGGEAYRLGNLPQGLKTLARRELGMEMQDFEDLVMPHSRELVIDYYRQVNAVTWPKPEGDLVQGDDGLWKVYKPHGMNTKLKTFFTYLGKDPDKDVFKAWENWEAEHAMIQAECGEWPGMCISHVPFDEVIFYACRDADALIRLRPILRAMQRRVRKFPQEQWRVA